jgi:hypothetical protein
MLPNNAAYVVPDDPANPEAAALELIVRLPETVLQDTGAREALQELTGMLDAEAAFAGMTWRDARHAAAAIMVDALERDDAPERLRARAERVLDGTDGMGWNDPAKMARALSIGATVLGL